MRRDKGLFAIELSLGLALFEFWRHLLGRLRTETWRKNSNSASLSLSSIANNPLHTYKVSTYPVIDSTHVEK